MKNNIFILAILGTTFATNLTAQQTFKSVTIGSQVWMTVNLNVSTFRNGDTIPEAKEDAAWIKAGAEGIPVWCYYENDVKNHKKYGKLYNWHTVNDPRGLAPKGWHIPTNDEWIVLINLFHGPTAAAYYLKSKKGWAQKGNGDNSSNFSALPGGCVKRAVLNFYTWEVLAHFGLQL